jgi:hypothetical protein
MNSELKLENWKEVSPNYWVNQKTKWIVWEISKEEGEQWVILDDRKMMISCEWKDNKEDCMDEADVIYYE